MKAQGEDLTGTPAAAVDPQQSRPGFSTPEKRDRYRTERYAGAGGLNWLTCDPALQRALRYCMTPEEHAWAEPHLVRLGALMGGPIAQRAEQTDKSPPRLLRYDRWGNEIGEVVLPDSLIEAKRDYFRHSIRSPALREQARRAGVDTDVAAVVQTYLLCQADIGLACAVGTGGDMIRELVARFAPPAVCELVLGKLDSGEWEGETAQLLTERTGGSDLGMLETTARPHGEAWLLNGVKWFASNANGKVYVVLAKPVGAPDSVKGVCSFLVMRQRLDGSPNGVILRQLKDKLGTRSVASAEVELVDAEAFLLADQAGASGKGAGDGQGLARMMQMTNASRLGVATMGLGCARRALVESLCYARARSAFGRPLIEQPLMRRKLAEMIVDVEAGLAMLLDAYGFVARRRTGSKERLRLLPGLTKLKAARLGITSASDAIEIHGGNGYVETWPVARLLRDAQVNTIWEGADNIVCLDVRRAMEREQAEVPFLGRLREAIGNAGQQPAAALVERRLDDLEAAIEGWRRLEPETAEARLFSLAQFMAELYAGAVLAEQAAWELAEYGDRRKSIVAELYARRYLGDAAPTRDIDAPQDLALEHFEELVRGALVDERPC